MYVKNISAILKEQLPLKLKFLEGNTLFGKIIILEDNKGAIKLYDGTIIPAIFINENKLEKNKYTKFVIQNFDGEQMILKACNIEDQNIDTKSLYDVMNNLNLPYDKGKDIIMSLLKFNLPATDENVMEIYKNINFIDIIINMNDDKILDFLRKNINSSINKSSSEFSICKDTFTKLNKIDSEFLSFLKENNISLSINNIINTKEFIDNKFFYNYLIDKLMNNIAPHGIIDRSDMVNKTLRSLIKIIDSNNDSMPMLSLDDVIKCLKENPDWAKNLPDEIAGKLLDNTYILNKLNNNYSFYFFNLYGNTSLLRNSIVVKNTYKSSKYIDINDVKVFISVDTSKLGTIEGFLYKKNNDLIISLKAKQQFVSFIKDQLGLLKSNLTNKGYNVIDLSIESINLDNGFSDISDFFSDGIFKELDVKV